MAATKFDPLATGKHIVSSVSTRDFTGWLVAVLIILVGFVGAMLFNRLDKLSDEFNSYAIRVENRITILEQHMPKRVE